jgi:hypothetical protein
MVHITSPSYVTVIEVSQSEADRDNPDVPSMLHSLGKLKAGNSLEDLGIGGRIILKCMLK